MASSGLLFWLYMYSDLSKLHRGLHFKQVWDRIAPGLASRFDSPYTVPVIAPRPLLILNGKGIIYASLSRFMSIIWSETRTWKL